MNKRQFLMSSAKVAALATPVAATLGAGEAVAATPAATKSLTVEAVQMPAWIVREGARVPLAPGDRVSTAQEVLTGDKSALVLRLPEGSIIRLGEKTRLGIQRLEVDPADGGVNVKSDLKLFDGFFRFTTSVVAKAVGQRQIDVNLRTATIGIRGTDFWSMTDDAHDAACLFEGKVDLATRDQGALSLDKPTAFWARFFAQPVRPVGVATPDELAKFLASTEGTPGQGIAVQGGRWRVVAGAPGSASAASALAARLRDQGYPVEIRAKTAGTATVHEVRINRLATRADAQAVLDHIGGIEGVRGRVALMAV